MIASAVFVALQKKFPLSSKFLWNPGSIPKTYIFCRSGESIYMAGLLVKSGCNVLGWHMFLSQKLEAKIVSLVSVHCHTMRTASLRPLTILPQVCTVWCAKLRKHFNAIMEVFHRCDRLAWQCIRLQWREKVGSCSAHAKQGGSRVRQQWELTVRFWLFGPHWSSCQKIKMMQCAFFYCDLWKKIELSCCCAIAYVVLSQKNWRALVYINWINSNRRVDEGVTVAEGVTVSEGVTVANCRINRLLFSDELVHAWIFNRVFSLHLIGFLMRATKQERKSALKSLSYCVFQDAQGGVFCKWGEIHYSRWRRSSISGAEDFFRSWTETFLKWQKKIKSFWSEYLKI